jgi:hypothetical protein
MEDPKDWAEAYLRGDSAFDAADDEWAARQSDSNGGYHERESRTRLTPVAWRDIGAVLPQRAPLIGGLLDIGSFSVIYGASGARKSFFAFDLGAHIALDFDWRGRDVQQGPVLLIAPDAGVGLRERMAAWAKYHKVDVTDAPLYVIAEPIDLCRSPADADLVLRHVSKLADTGVAVDLILIDTLSRALAGGDENSPRDMGSFVHQCDRIRSASGAHLMAVHHAGKDESKGARGHSLLRAATDTEIEIVAQGETSIATVMKQRDHKIGDAFTFQLASVDLGDGKSSCVPIEAEQKAHSRSTRRVKLPASAQMALDALRQTLTEDGSIPPVCNHIPANTLTVTESLWRRYSYERGISKGGDRARERAFERGAERLIADNLVAKWGDQCWTI